MISNKTWKISIRCQNGTQIETEVPVNAGKQEKNGTAVSVTDFNEDDIRIGKIDLEILPVTLADIPYTEKDKPVQVRIPVEELPEKITAFYMFNPWWTRPAFCKDLSGIPERTQIALFKMKDRCVCLLPMVGDSYKAVMTAGSADEIVFEMTAGIGGIRRISEPLFIMSEGQTSYEAVHKIFAYLKLHTGLRLREERTVPEVFRYLGWCSWDAFYTEVSDEKIRQKAQEMTERNVPVRWFLIDDGWFGAREKMLADLRPDHEKFPEGFKRMTDEIRANSSIKWFGVWHALGGYWDGIAPGSPAEQQEQKDLYQNRAGSIVPDPGKGAGFYKDWHKLLRSEGIDFVKVDGQSAVPFYYQNGFPLAKAAREIAFSLESGACIMNGAMINCMGMGMETVLSRPASAVSRNSDDFLPAKEESFAEHLIQNAYNSVYHNEIYCCDWDMFWTNHKHAGKHSLLRAISGGPVYVSDRVGETDPEVLRPLTYADGRILMLERSAKPTEDCIFTDSTQNGVLKLHNIGKWGQENIAGGVAVYNLTDRVQTFVTSPSDVPELDKDQEYWIYDFLEKAVVMPESAKTAGGGLGVGDYKWFVFLPKGQNGSCLGLSDKYCGFTAVEAMFTEGNTDTVVLKGTGNVSWISGKSPVKVLAGGRKVTDQMSSNGCLHTLRLPESAEKAVITITWS